MVRVTSDWKGFKNYSEHCKLGVFQVRTTEEGTLVKVAAGRLGFEKVFTNLEEPEESELYQTIMAFCDHRGFVKINYSISDELFLA